MTIEPLAEAYRATNGFQAHLVANFLKEAGIPAIVDGEELNSIIGEISTGWSTSPRVMVAENHLVEARALIEAAENFDDGPLVDEAELTEEAMSDEGEAGAEGATDEP